MPNIFTYNIKITITVPPLSGRTADGGEEKAEEDEGGVEGEEFVAEAVAGEPAG